MFTEPRMSILSSDSTFGERTPLLHKTESTRGDSSKPDPDVIDELESLPMMLVRAVAIFTLTTVASILCGAIRVLVSFAIPKAVCIVPTLLAEIWLVYQLVMAVKWLRRAMIGEERKRRQTLRGLARRRREARAQMEAAAPTTLDMGREDSLDSTEPGASRAPVTVTRAVAAAVAAGKASHADVDGASTPPSAPPISPDGSPSAKRTFSLDTCKAEIAEQESKADHHPPFASARDESAEGAMAAGAGEEDAQRRIICSEDMEEASGMTEEWSETPSKSFASTPKHESLPRHLREQLIQLNQWPDQNRVAAISARAVRVSYLLQLWVRLWLTMAAFMLTSDVLVILITLRLLGMSPKYLPASIVASPVILALAILALHSVIMLDGGGGTGGGAALRGGGSRSCLALGRRPIIFLFLFGLTLASIKQDLAELRLSGAHLTRLKAFIDQLSWSILLSPLWLALALVEGVFLRALWENRTGRNCISSISWSYEMVVECLGCGDYLALGQSRVRRRRTGRRSEARVRRQTTFHDQRANVALCSSIRRRASLTTTQRAAAGAISGGILFIVLSMVGCSVRQDNQRNAVWAIPSILFSAAIGQALIGAGLWRLALDFSNRVREGIPPATKPLPVLYSEREGGWVVGPADPPTISVFLLGEVVLRQEGLGVSCPGGNGCYDMDSQHYYTTC